jgi:hypothetical protein
MSRLPDTHSPPFQRLTMALAKIGRNHPYIGHTDPDTVRHQLIDRSVVALPFLDSDEHVLDVGTGVGIPGIPLALCQRSPSITLLEPRSECVALARWLMDRCLERDLPVIQSTYEDAELTEKDVNLLISRAALDWTTLRTHSPGPIPILRWTGPDVAEPPDDPDWTFIRVQAHPERLSSPQELTWWAPDSMFHVKQSTLDDVDWLTLLD